MKIAKVFLIFAVFIALCFLTASFSIAEVGTEKYGLIDYFNSFPETDLSGLYAHPDLLVSDVNYVEGECVRAEVTEYVYDGHSLYLLLEVVPIDGNVFLYDAWDDLDEYMSDGLGQEGFSDAEYSYAEYARKNGKSRFISIEPEFGFEDVSALYSARLYAENGKLLYYVEADPIEMSAPLSAVISITITEANYAETLEFHVEYAPRGELNVAQDGSGCELEDVGVRIDRVTVVYSEITTYYSVEYSVADQKAFNAAEDQYNLWFEVAAPDGNKFTGGLVSPAIYRLDDDKFKLLGTAGFSEKIGDALIVRAFDANTKKVLAEAPVQLTP